MFHSTCDAPGDKVVGDFAQAMSGAPLQAIGQIQTTSGSVTVTSASGAVVQANCGDFVCQHDTIETGADGNIGIIFNDGTAFNLSSNGRMVLSEFVYDPNGKSNSTLFSLSKGTFTFIPGKAAESTDLRIDTPVGRIRGSAREGGIGILTLAGLTFSVMDQIQAASQPPHGFLDDGAVTVGNQASSRSHAFLDDDRLTYKHLPHGGYEITMRDGRVIMHDDPGETIQIDPSGTVTHIPNSSSRMADLQNFQQAALSTLSQAPQGAAPGGSSTDTFNAPLELIPINFTRPENGAVQNQVTVNIAPTTSGFVEVVRLQPPPTPPTPPTPETPPPTATPTIAISTIAGQISVAADSIINASKANTGVNIAGTTSGVEDGRIVTITIVDGFNHAVYNTTTTVTNGTWLIDVSSTDAKLLADGSYTLKADVSNTAGDQAQISQAITVDETAPTVTVAGLPTLKAGQTDTITFTFSEAVTGFDNASVTVTGGTLSAITQVNATTYTAVFTPAANFEGAGSVQVVAGVWTDTVGNPGPTSNTLLTTEDTKGPTVTVAGNLLRRRP